MKGWDFQEDQCLYYSLRGPPTGLSPGSFRLLFSGRRCRKPCYYFSNGVCFSGMVRVAEYWKELVSAYRCGGGAGASTGRSVQLPSFASQVIKKFQRSRGYKSQIWTLCKGGSWTDKAVPSNWAWCGSNSIPFQSSEVIRGNERYRASKDIFSGSKKIVRVPFHWRFRVSVVLNWSWGNT